MNTAVQESQDIMGSIAIGDDVKMDEYKFFC
jgi:hypothetical protein